MSGVDVLAVMDADARAVSIVIDSCNSMHRRQKWDDHLADHDLARAAVAELIEAATALDSRFALFSARGIDTDAFAKAKASMRAALARITGGA